MRGQDRDVELDGGLDGASIYDDAPEPDDEPSRLRQNPRAAVRVLPQMRQLQQRQKVRRLESR